MDLPSSTMVILLVIGVAVGVVGGMAGIGGGILIIPILMFVFGFSQARANGTSLAMLLPPIGIFAVLAYTRTGNVNWPFAAILALGFAFGAYLGARLVNDGWINPTALRVSFALLLIYCAGRILFRPGGRGRAALETFMLVVIFAGTYTAMRLLGKQWKNAPHWGSIYRDKQREFIEYDYEI